MFRQITWQRPSVGIIEPPRFRTMRTIIPVPFERILFRYNVFGRPKDQSPVRPL